jgi:undecaprenyl-diphosphatase
MLAATRAGDGWALAVIIPLCLLFRGWFGLAIVVTGAFSATLVALLVHAIKVTVRRHRPAGPGVDRPITARDFHAFPSGHSAQAFGMLVLMAWLSPVTGLVGVPVALSVGASRVFFGLHYPTDVVAGALLGTLVTLAVIWGTTITGLVAWIAGHA